MSSVGEIIHQLSLPDEMWAEIFSHLPLCDRKCIRLSCSRFYDVVNSARFQQNEKIVISGRVDETEIEKMCHSRRKLWNIELNHLLPEDTCVVRVFQEHSLRIRSLTLLNCELPHGTFRKIIESSVQLRHLTLSVDSYVGEEYLSNLQWDLRVLHHDGFSCPEVRSASLEMEISSDHLLLVSVISLGDQFSKFRAIFPNIADLQLSISLGEDFDQSTGYRVCALANLLTDLENLEKYRPGNEFDEILRKFGQEVRHLMAKTSQESELTVESLQKYNEQMKQKIQLMIDRVKTARSRPETSGLNPKRDLIKFSLNTNSTEGPATDALQNRSDMQKVISILYGFF